MKKQLLLSILIVVCGLVVVGCSAAPIDINAESIPATLPTPRPERPDINTTGILMTHVTEAAPLVDPFEDGGSRPNTGAVAQGANDFAFVLSAALLESVEDENFVVSPFSIWMPLAALLNATGENYRDDIIEILAASGASLDDINRTASRMLFTLTNERARQQGWGDGMEENPLKIANAVFVDYRNTLQADFIRSFADYFRGSAINVDFASPDAVNAINQWAYDNTNGRIPRVLEEVDSETDVAIANAIYFSDTWINQFNPYLTERDVFHSPSGDVYAYFMRQAFHNTSYFEDEQMQSLTLHFNGNGGMTILLPKDGDAVALLSSMNNEKFAAIANDSVIANGTLLLPRFSIENTLTNLADVLIALGLDVLFCGNTLPLDGLIYSEFPCFITDAVQVAMIEVDEEGATAAAVTIMPMVAGSAPLEPTVIFEMICNVPFAFILHGHTVDGGRQILFTGVVNNP